MESCLDKNYGYRQARLARIPLGVSVGIDVRQGLERATLVEIERCRARTRRCKTRSGISYGVIGSTTDPERDSHIRVVGRVAGLGVTMKSCTARLMPVL